MKKLYLIIVLTILTSIVLAQGNFTDKWYFGGGMGLNIGTDITNISAAPMVGYKITSTLSVGTGIIYQYINFKNIDRSLAHYGGSIFLRQFISRQLFATTEYEYLSLEYFNSRDFSSTARRGFGTYFIGGGYVQPLGANTAFSLVGLYNVFYDPAKTSPYNSPFIIRAGFTVGF